MDILLRNKVLENLRDLQDLKYRDFHTKLIPGADKDLFIGVRMPQLRKYMKQIAKDGEANQVIENILEIAEAGKEPLYYEERVICGILIGMTIKDYDTWENLARRFVPLIDNWAVCDGACASMKVIAKHQHEAWPFLKKYLEDNREYYIRFGVVMLMDWFIDEEYIDRVLLELQKAKTDDYYAMMAVAWALSVCFVKFPEKTMEVIKTGSLDVVTHNKTIQKIRESYRVDAETKKELQNYRR